MARRQPSSRATVASALGAFVAAMVVALRALHDAEALALAAIVLVLVIGLCFLLWAIRDTRKEAVFPLQVDLKGATAFRDDAHVNRRTIRIINTSHQHTVHGVTVELVRCDQQQANFYPVQLQRVDGGAQPFDLNPLGRLYVEVILKKKSEMECEFCYDKSTPWPRRIAVDGRPLDIGIRISAEDAAGEDHDFAVSLDKSGNLHLIQVDRRASLLEPGRFA